MHMVRRLGFLNSIYQFDVEMNKDLILQWMLSYKYRDTSSSAHRVTGDNDHTLHTL
jgi:hypothetical protein